MKHVVIVNYGMGNLDSVARAVEECGARPVVTDQHGDLATADSIILPGVGSFADGMRNIRERRLDAVLQEQVALGIPLLGICLGMHLLAEKGTEGALTDGLGLVAGEVTRLKPDGPGVRIPHVGWNEVHVQSDSPLLAGVISGTDFYFVHSYHLICRDRGHVLATTPYCGGFASVVGRNSVFGVQFHPEKSQGAGFRLLRNFLAL